MRCKESHDEGHCIHDRARDAHLKAREALIEDMIAHGAKCWRIPRTTTQPSFIVIQEAGARAFIMEEITGPRVLTAEEKERWTQFLGGG